MEQENRNTNAATEEKKTSSSEELDLDALDQVAGGVGLRDVKKVKTTDISQDTIRRI